MDNYDFGHVSTGSFVLMGIGAFLAIVIPVIVAVIWCRKKKEPFTTVLIGAATFMLFAIVLEKPLQNILIFPVQMGLPEHAASVFINARPVLWGFLLGFFPGLFEETGRFVAFKTLLRKRKQRETSISHGIGHGGFEVMLIIGLNLVSYIMMGLMINNGSIAAEINKALETAPMPGMAEQITATLNQVSSFNIATLGVTVIDRVIAVLYHTGASILVFYACKDKKKFWLYPFAIVIHTLVDGFLGLQMTGLFTFPNWANEVIFGTVSLATFFGGYILLYRKDKKGIQKTSN